MKRNLLRIATPVLAASFLSLPAFALEDLATILGGQNAQKEDVLQHSTLVTAIQTEAGRTGSEQQILFRHLEAQDWPKALIQYGPAFGGTDYEKTPSGRALKALIAFKSGLTVSGVEDFFAIAEPKKVHAQILQSWKDALPVGHPVWENVSVQWAPVWTEIFGPVAEVKVRLREILGSRDIEFLKSVAAKTEANSPDRAFVYWQLVLAYSLNDQADLAAKILSQLMQTEKAPVGQELMNLTAARLLYQNGYFEAAQKYYDKIPKTSEYWLEAQEEQAWAAIRRGQPQNALAYSLTLVNPAFKGQVGPESYFVRALAQLKICDYPGTVDTLALFPKMFKERSISLQTISREPSQPVVEKTLVRLQKERLRIEDLRSDAHLLPRYLVRDEKLGRLVKARVYYEGEARRAEEIYAQSLAQTGLQAEFEALKQRNVSRAEQARSAALARVKDIAAKELEETRQMIQKLHIVEAEVIQQVEIATRLTALSGKEAVSVKTGTTGSAAKDVLRFPVEKEIWFDELAKYKVDIKKGCQAKRAL